MITKEELEVLKSEALKEDRESMKKVEEFFTGLTDKKIKVTTNIYLHEFSGEIDFLDTTGKSVFSADFDWSYRTRYGSDEPEFRMGCGTSGQISRKECPEQIDRLRMMTAVWDHEAELTTLLDALPHTAESAYLKADSQYEREQRAIRQAEVDKEMAEAKAKITVGYTFTESTTKEQWNYDKAKYETVPTEDVKTTVMKITPKRVYLRCEYDVAAEQYRAIDGSYVKVDGIRHITTDGYVNVDYMVDYIMDYSKHETNGCIRENLAGKETNYTFTEAA